MEKKSRESEKIKKYVTSMKRVLKKRAVFSDETKYYRTPFEAEAGDEVTVRIRIARNNADAVYFISGHTRDAMYLADTKDGFDFYEYRIKLENEVVCYYFEIDLEERSYYYNKLGITRDLSERNAFRIVPGFRTPEWARGAVMYQIFTDRFANGCRSNKVLTGEYSYIGGQSQLVEDWYKCPENMDVRNFYGGDIEGIEQKLDYLEDLGVEVLYLNPIFVSPSNHKYDIQDYDHVDPHLTRILNDSGDLLPEGELENRYASRYIKRVTDQENLAASNAFFARFCHEVHRRGMKIILDGVFNHCGSFNKWMDRERIYEHIDGYPKGAYVSGDSPYRSYFKFNNEHAWPYNEFYDGWWGHDTLPKLNYEESEELVGEILRIAKKWLEPPFNVDGWRLDVAADLGHSAEYNHRFWKMFREAVKSVDRDALILAEHYGEAYEWLKGDEWDSVMNYDAFMEPVSWFLTGMEKHSDIFRQDLLGNGDSFRDAVNYHMASFMAPSLQCAMNELDNHDHSRFLTRTNHYVGRVDSLGSAAASENIDPSMMRAAVLIQMTFVGAPTLYYGDEAGVTGFTDPDSRRTYPWGREDKDLLSFYKMAIRLHKSHKVLTDGSYKDLGSGSGKVIYGRFSDLEQVVVAVNSDDEPKTVLIPVWEMGVTRRGNTSMETLMTTWKDGYEEGGPKREVIAGTLTLELRPHEAAVLMRRKQGNVTFL